MGKYKRDRSRIESATRDCTQYSAVEYSKVEQSRVVQSSPVQCSPVECSAPLTVSIRYDNVSRRRVRSLSDSSKPRHSCACSSAEKASSSYQCGKATKEDEFERSKAKHLWMDQGRWRQQPTPRSLVSISLSRPTKLLSVTFTLFGSS